MITDQLDELTIKARIAGAIDTQLNQLRLMANVNQLHKTVGLKAETIYDIHEASKKLISVAEKVIEENKILLNQLQK
jgi:hypothetical protein